MIVKREPERSERLLREMKKIRAAKGKDQDDRIFTLLSNNQKYLKLIDFLYQCVMLFRKSARLISEPFEYKPDWNQPSNALVASVYNMFRDTQGELSKIYEPQKSQLSKQTAATLTQKGLGESQPKSKAQFHQQQIARSGEFIKKKPRQSKVGKSFGAEVYKSIGDLLYQSQLQKCSEHCQKIALLEGRIKQLQLQNKTLLTRLVKAEGRKKSLSIISANIFRQLHFTSMVTPTEKQTTLTTHRPHSSIISSFVSESLQQAAVGRLEQLPSLVFMNSRIIPGVSTNPDPTHEPEWGVEHSRRFVISALVRFLSPGSQIEQLLHLCSSSQLIRHKVSFHRVVGNVPSLLLLLKLRHGGDIIGAYSRNGITGKTGGSSRPDRGFIFSCGEGCVLKPVERHRGRPILPHSSDDILLGNHDLILKVDSSTLVCQPFSEDSTFRPGGTSEDSSLLGMGESEVAEVEEFEFYQVVLS